MPFFAVEELLKMESLRRQCRQRVRCMTKIPEFDKGKRKLKPSLQKRRPPSAENHHPLKLNFERYTLGTWIQLAIANGVKLAIRTNLSFLCPPPCISPNRFYVFSCAVPRDRAKFPPRMEKFDRCNGRKWKVNEVFTCAGSTGRGIAICRESAFTSSLSFVFIRRNNSGSRNGEKILWTSQRASS